MPRASAAVVVRRSPAELFAFVADLRNEPSWHVDVASVPDTTDPVPVVGKTYPVLFKPFLGKTEGTYTAVEVVPGERVVYDAELGGITPRITHAVTPEGTGARFTRSVELTLHGPLKLVTPVMALLIPRRNKVFVENLGKVLAD